MADPTTIGPTTPGPPSPTAPPPTAPSPTRRAELGPTWRVYRHLVVAQIRGEWQYRTSFLFFLLAQALITALELAAIVILLDVVPDLGGWSPAEVAVLYGLATVPFALTDVVVSPVEALATHVREGTFDRLLLRPVPAIVQLCALEFELRRAGKLLPNLAALVWGLSAVDLDWGPWSVAIVVLAVVSGSGIYASLWIVSAATSFWAVAALEATHSITFGGQFANQYPLHLYPGWIRAVLGWVVPLAFVAYVPSTALLDAPNPLGLPEAMVLLAPLVAAAALGGSLLVWSTGIRHYQGTGS